MSFVNELMRCYDSEFDVNDEKNGGEENCERKMMKNVLRELKNVVRDFNEIVASKLEILWGKKENFMRVRKN